MLPPPPPPPLARSICVFCASRPGTSPAFTQAAEALGGALAARRWGLVYGGGNRGLMGSVATTMARAGAPVRGVMVRSLIQREVAGEMDRGENTIVETMHERKTLMAERADAFVALPGGFGTLDELIEILTWSQIGIHAKPIVLFNVDGFFDSFLRMVDDFFKHGFVDEATRGILSIASTAEEVVSAIENYVPPEGRLDLDWKVEKPDTSK